MNKRQIRRWAQSVRYAACAFGGKVDFSTLCQYAKHKNYTVVCDDVNSANSLSFVFTKEDRKFIYISNKADQSYATELLAHELGHIVLNHKLIFAKDDVNAEQEADYFAKCLLKSRHHKLIIAALSIILACTLVFSAVGLVNHNQLKTQPGQLESTQTAQITGKYDDQVFITPSGTKYHKSDCQYVDEKSDILTLTQSEAEQAGYEPCKICFK